LGLAHAKARSREVKAWRLNPHGGYGCHAEKRKKAGPIYAFSRQSGLGRFSAKAGWPQKGARIAKKTDRTFRARSSFLPRDEFHPGLGRAALQ
jgi:hypothetical protein